MDLQFFSQKCTVANFRKDEFVLKAQEVNLALKTVNKSRTVLPEHVLVNNVSINSLPFKLYLRGQVSSHPKVLSEHPAGFLEQS